MKLKPFFSYYGSKWRSIPKYPEPKYDTIIEPFAGSATYALHYSDREIILYEKNEDLVYLWNYLIEATPDEIMSLPVFGEFDHLDEIDVPYGARMLIGYSMQEAGASIRRQFSAWAKDDKKNRMGIWNKDKRKRVAEQIEAINHWKCYHTPQLNLVPNREATWFIDPPYQDAGYCYKHSSKQLDFQQLAIWSKTRNGQVIVCENEGADWLRFDYIYRNQSVSGKQKKHIFRNEVFAHIENGQYI